jgi:hypothetical protein
MHWSLLQRQLVWIGLLLCPLWAVAVPLRSGTASFTAQAPRDTLFTLPVTWIVLDSVQVYRNDIRIGEFSDWRIAEPGNRIWVYTPLGPRDTLRVTYQYQPIPLYRTYLRHSLREIGRETREGSPADSGRIVPAFAPENEPLEGWSRLNKSGSLLRSVQIGTGQDLQLESALNIQIQGRVGKNVDVIAALTDQTTPIQPEGTTETISELEKVFVSVRMPHLQTTLGDYQLKLPGGQYDSYSRKLTGVFGEADYGGFRLTAGGAVSRGQFFSNTFLGQEANQGPYPLRGRNGEIGMVVLAGTEKVWLDGEALRRGEGNDYTVDYSSGEISFTSRRVITSTSRIVVDFEYSNEDYERFYGAGRLEAALGNDRLGGAVTYLTESDDRSRPIRTGFTDSDRAILAAAGSNPDSAVAPSADSIGVNGGDYIRQDTLYAGVEYLVYVFSPRDSLNKPTGQWRVLFDDFGLGHGDYEARADTFGLTYFRWVGPQQGRYRSFRRLPLPTSQSVVDARGHVEPVKGIQLSGEMAFSQKDLNTFSGNKATTTNGVAYSGGVGLTRSGIPLGLFTLDRVEASAKLRHRDSRFHEMTRVSEIEFQRSWDAPVNAGVAETIRETDVRITPLSGMTVSGGYGDLSRPGSYASRRRTAGLTATWWQRWTTSASVLTLQSEDSILARRSHWLRESGRVNGSLNRFTPRGGAEFERRRDVARNGLSGFRYLEYFSGMGVSLPANLAVDGEYRRRTEDRLDSSDVFHPAATAAQVATEASWMPLEGGRTLMRYTHREKKFVRSLTGTADSTDISTDVGRIETLIVPRNRLFEINTVYEVAKTRSQNQILIAVQVPAGTGQYRREGDRFVADDQGDYLLVPRYTGAFDPATDLSLNSQIAIRPDELQDSDLPSWIQALSTETEVVLSEKTRKPLSLRLLLLNQGEFRGDSTLAGTVSLRQDIMVRRLSSKLSVRLRYRETQSLQNQYLNGGQGRIFREGGVRVRARYISLWRGETETVYSRETLRYASGIFPDRDINRFDLTQSNTLSLSSIWEAGADLHATEARDERTATQVSLREVRPHAALTLFGKGRFDTDFSWIRASSNKAAIPYELGRGSNRGDNLRWSVRGTYQFGQYFSGTLDYSGRHDAGEQVYHTGRLEVRASF